MKIFFDARYIRISGQDGISRYSRQLALALSKLTDVTFIICDNRQKKLLPSNSSFINFHKPTSILEPFSSIILNRYRPDIVFSPMQTIGSLGKKFRLILTIHDFIYYRHKTTPSEINPILKILWRLYHMSFNFEKIILKNADAIVTVSQTTKRELLKLKLTSSPVYVIPNAPLDATSKPHRTTKKPTQLIYMGSFFSYKNVETLIRGMKFLDDCTLHLLSKISNERKNQLLAISPNPESIIFHNGVSDSKYRRLLQDNSILVSASLDEGYGLPVAEALSLGVPAVISDNPGFREVAGDGAIYFNPTDPDAFARAIRNMQIKTVYDNHAQKGLSHVSRFSWDESARILLSTAEATLLQ